MRYIPITSCSIKQNLNDLEPLRKSGFMKILTFVFMQKTETNSETDLLNELNEAQRAGEFCDGPLSNSRCNG